MRGLLIPGKASKLIQILGATFSRKADRSLNSKKSKLVI